MESFSERIKGLLAETCGIDAASIDDQTHMVAYGLDSVRATDFMIGIEESFGIIINQADVPDLRTVADVVAYLDRRSGPGG